MANVTIDLKLLKELVNKGLHDREISKILNCCIQSVYDYRQKFNLRQGTDYRRREPIPLTRLQQEAMFGTLLGDGYLRTHRRSVIGRIDHCKKQEDYFNWKFSIFENLISLKKCEERKCTSCKSGKSESCYMTFWSNDYLKEFFEMFYVPKKEIPIVHLKEFYTPFAMAIHFMDDGTKDTVGYTLMTMGFPLENVKQFQEFLKIEYGLHTRLNKKGNIVFNKESAVLYTDIIKPYIIPSMMYKIHTVWKSVKKCNIQKTEVVDTVTNQIHVFESQNDASKFFGISSSSFCAAMKRGALYKKRYLLKRISKSK